MNKYLGIFWIFALVLSSCATQQISTNKDDEIKETTQVETKENKKEQLDFNEALASGDLSKIFNLCMPTQNDSPACQYLQNSCHEQKNGHACFYMAENMLISSDEDRKEKSNTYYELACRYKDKESCELIKEEKRKKKQEDLQAKLEIKRKREKEKVLVLIKKMCDQNNAKACAALGRENYDSGDKEAALPYYEKACDLKLSVGCYMASDMAYQMGSREYSKRLLRQACEMGNRQACKTIDDFAQAAKENAARQEAQARAAETERQNMELYLQYQERSSRNTERIYKSLQDAWFPSSH